MKRLVLYAAITFFMYFSGGLHWFHRDYGWVLYQFIGGTWWLHLTMETWREVARRPKIWETDSAAPGTREVWHK